MNNTKSIYAAAFAATLLSACGGGGGGGDSIDGTAEGFYEGSLADGREILGAVLPNGTYYVLYTDGLGAIGGFVQGSGTSDNGRFRSSSGTDFNFQGFGTSSVTVSADYRPKASLSGTVSSGGQTSSFSSTYSVEYEKTPALAVLAGTYTGITYDANGSATATVQIAANGTVTGTTSTGCDISGVTEPATQGNAYALGLTFSGVGCPINGLSLGGAAFLDSRTNELYTAAFDSARSYGAVFLGIR